MWTAEQDNRAVESTAGVGTASRKRTAARTGPLGDSNVSKDPAMTPSRIHLPRISRAVMTGLATLLPVIVSTILFPVLYNNLMQGTFILVSLILLNAAVLVIPNGRRSRVAVSWAKMGSLCVIAIVGAFLVVELVFPAVWPHEYARVRDLSKGVQKLSKEDLQWFQVVFTNGFERKVQPAGLQRDQDEVTVSWHKPGAEFEYYGYEPNEKFKYLNIIRWNSRGYFDREYEYAKRHDVYRMVFIGDSYVEAMQVPLNATFHKLMERNLNERKSTRRFEVIALGSSGTGLENHLKTLTSEAVSYHPDVVAVALCGNDFCDDDSDLRRERTLAMGDVTPEFRGLVRHGYLAAAFALRRWNELQMNRINVSPELLQWSAKDIPRIEAAWRRTLDTVRSARDFCASRQIRFMLVYVGSELELKYALNPEETMAELRKMYTGEPDFSWDMSKTVDRLRQYCLEHNIALVSLLEPLITAQRQTGKLVFGDHYTLFGHEVAAQTLQKALRSILPEDSSNELSVQR